MAAVIAAYPNTTKPSNTTDIDFGFRALAIKQADASAGAALALPSAYMHPLTHNACKYGACIKPCIVADIAFQFNNIARLLWK